ncbi:MAG: SDR family NAD(P)-dependent oxidoreductase [Nitrospirales bacterium]
MNREPIAIIGIGCRFPGAYGPEAFWELLRNGVDAITPVPGYRLELGTHVRPSPGKFPERKIQWGGFLENIDQFDPSIFGITPREAAYMSPQQRLLLETTWEALEHAGQIPAHLAGTQTGVFIGISSENISHGSCLHSRNQIKDASDALHLTTGTNRAIAANRISYVFDFRGPSVALDSACSSSLVATHLACQSLWSGESSLALAGGIELLLSQQVTESLAQAGFLAADGHCKTFDAQADGYVRGEGVGVIVLKSLSKALADRDPIVALIRGSAVNQDGRSNGLTAPNPSSQVALLRDAYNQAGVSPGKIQYIEAHGTGTKLGDPIEIKALGSVLSMERPDNLLCTVGSVKTNIGHLEAAAGIAGLIKVALSLKKQEIPPTLHFHEPNPYIPFSELPLRVQKTLAPWPNSGYPAFAAVSAFGFGGTNAHVVLEGPPPSASSGTPRPWQILIQSARSQKALNSLTEKLADHLEKNQNLSLADMAYSLSVARKAFEYRRSSICHDRDEAITSLRNNDSQPALSCDQASKERSVIFMFTGQGAQYLNMGKELYQYEPLFKKTVDECCEQLHPSLGLELRNVLFPQEEPREAKTRHIHETHLAQPALFVIEYALAKLWMSWGVHPHAMIGHSIGEYVAACLAEVFSLEDALRIVAMRGRLMQQMPKGAMLAVRLSEQEIFPFLGDVISLAAINGPNQCTLSGPTEGIDMLHQKLIGNNVICQPLQTSHAFHSPMMDPILNTFTEYVAGIQLHPPKIPYLSNLSGDWVANDEVTSPQYWANHLRYTVRFADGLTKLMQKPQAIFLEIGPGRTLADLAQQHLGPDDQRKTFSSIRHPKDKTSDMAYLFKTVGELWKSGTLVDWKGFYCHENRQRLPLPSFPFDRQRYWNEAENPEQDGPISFEENYKKSDIGDWFYLPSWKRSLPPQLPIGNNLDKNVCWLVFQDSQGLATELEFRLKERGHGVVSVRVGSDFTQLNEHAYVINPNDHADYATLFTSLIKQGNCPNRVVHLWNITSLNAKRSDQCLSEDCVDYSFYSLMYVAQALATLKHTIPIQITALSNNIHEVTGEETLCPETAPILGLCKVIPQEFPHIHCRNVDIALPIKQRNHSRTVEQILGEILHASPDPIVAYRGNHRLVQEFEPVYLDAPPHPLIRLKKNGVYLITGGLGGIGIVLGEYLAHTLQARLVLTQRSPFPHRAEWETWLTTHDERDSTSQKIRRIRDWEALGARILLLRADVCDQRSMQEVASKTLKEFGPINGVIHAAGIPDGVMLQKRTREDTEKILAPKIKGTLVLDRVFRDANLDFVVLSSSLASIIGPFGQVGYCAANAFLDAFAYKKNSTGGPFTISINWDLWQEVGMAVDGMKNLEGFLTQERKVSEDNRLLGSVPEDEMDFLKDGLVPAEGVEVFKRILNCSLSQVVVSTRDFPKRVRQSQRINTKIFETMSQKPQTADPSILRPNLTTTYLAPRTPIEEALAEIWQKVLGLQHVGVHDNFFYLGGDSLLATQAMSRIRDTFQVEVPLRELFESPTIDELAKILEDTQS